MREMDYDTTEWLARWGDIARRESLALSPDGDGWRLDPVPAVGTVAENPATISEEVRRQPDGRVIARRMTREEVQAFFGPADGAI